jgi:CHAT domain-containing protein
MQHRFQLIVFIATSITFTAILPAQAELASDLIQQGKLAYERGQFQIALTQWQQATTLYQKAQNPIGIAGSQLNQAQAFTAMGMHRRACKTLITALQLPILQAKQLCEVDFATDPIPASPMQSSQLRTMGLHQLGEVLRLIGNLERSQQVLFQAQQDSSPPDRNLSSSILLSLGNTARDMGNRERNRTNESAPKSITTFLPKGKTCNTTSVELTSAIEAYQTAIDCYQQAATNSANPITSLQARLNHLSLILEVAQWLQHNDQTNLAEPWLTASEGPKLLHQIRKDLSSLPFSYEAGYANVNFARSLVQWASLTKSTAEYGEAQNLLQSILSSANLDDNTNIAVYVNGNLGWLYEQRRDWENALKYTQKALQQSTQGSPDVLYQWKWQQGRILRQQANPTSAITAYEDAVRLLESARQDVQSVNPDAQFALRDNVEPVYRELIDLQLQSASPNYESIIKRIDALQLAELENFLRCKLNVTKPTSASNVAKEQSAAVIYPVILDDRLEVIARLPNNQFLRHTVSIQRTQLNAQIQAGYENLVLPQNGDDYQPFAEQMYEHLIRPFQSQLRESGTKTLVFMLDGELRRIPMAALRDAQTQQFLIDQYPIAVTPGSNILREKPFPREHLKALIGGLTNPSTVSISVKGKPFIFEPLKGVREEVNTILSKLPQSKLLIDNEFKPDRIQQEIQTGSYSILHLATHGNFSSDPQMTFLVADGAKVVSIDKLKTSIRQRDDSRNQLDLIVFSACQTAAGDRRATLGMAGAAILAGASSTLATLWSVSDKPTVALVDKFYGILMTEQSATKAEALQLAQQKIRSQYPHPAYWASFVLVGSWR